jgi:hypothetical protein
MARFCSFPSPLSSASPFTIATANVTEIITLRPEQDGIGRIKVCILNLCQYDLAAVPTQNLRRILRIAIRRPTHNHNDTG